MIWRHQIFVGLAIMVVMAGCAVSEPDGEISNNDGDTDAGPEADADVDDGDLCDECTDQQICIDDQCVDICQETGTECGVAELEGEQADCGGCPVGECDESEGLCPDICEELDARCGPVYFGGETFDCGSCDSGAVCLRTNRCSAATDYVDVTAGRDHTCAIRPSGAVRCWGANDHGQLGDDDMPEPSAEPSTVIATTHVDVIASLNNHTCAVQDDDLLCWGLNDHGRLGNDRTETTSTPVEVYGVSGNYVATGGSHSCAWGDDDGVMICWGDNVVGQLGAGDTDTDPQRRATVVSGADEPLEGVFDAGLGTTHGCAVDRDNKLWCWGENRRGQMGQGNTQDGSPFAQSVTDMTEPVLAVAAGFNHSCAIDDQRRIWCWGEGDDGQIGQENATIHPSPVQVDLPGPAIDVDAGRRHSCAVIDTGNVYCWGDNARGQTGQSTITEQVNEPARVGGINRAISVGAGARHSCVVTESGELYCWGDNEQGQLGRGSFDNGTHLPVQVDG